MKTISNKETAITDIDGKLMTRADLLILVADKPPAGGMTIAIMRERTRITDVIEKAGKGDITLEDNDFNNLKVAYESFGWGKKHKDLLDLADHLSELSKNK